MSHRTSGTRGGRPGLLLAVWALLLIVFAVSAPMVQRTLGIPFELLALVMLAPAAASLIVLIRPSWLPRWWPHVPAGRVLVSSAAGLFAVVGFVATLALLTGRAPSWTAPGIASPLWLFLLLQTVGALGEEVGWRGVVQRAGEQFAKPAVVSAIAGFLFGVTHLGYWSLGLVPVATFGFVAMLMSLTITTLFTGTLWQRMITAVVVHLGVNLGIASLADADEPLATTLPALAAAAVMFALAVAFASVHHRASSLRTTRGGRTHPRGRRHRTRR